VLKEHSCGLTLLHDERFFGDNGWLLWQGGGSRQRLRQGSLTARRKALTLVEWLASPPRWLKKAGEYNFKLMWYGLAMAFFRESTQNRAGRAL